MRIDLPCCPLKSCRYHFDGNCTDAKHYEDCILMREMVQIPQNVTNGDVIKTLFPHSEAIFVLSNVAKTDVVSIENEAFLVDRDWWNAPYKKEGDGE